MENQDLINWLLEDGIPSVRYRTLTELLEKDGDDRAVVETKRVIPESKDVVRIFKKMHPDGYWLQRRSSKGDYLGDGVEYGSFATTHFVLAYLSELGMDVNDERVNRAADRYLGLQAEDGDFWQHLSCLYSYNIRTFIRLGLRDDPRVQKSIDLMLGTERDDGGYLCDLHEGKRKTRPMKSCIRGSAKALTAFAELPGYHNHPRCLQLVEYFLERGGIFRQSKPDTPVNDDTIRTVFPFIWRTSLTEILYGLSKLGYGKDARLDRAWEILEKKRDGEGRYRLEWTTTSALLKAGKRGEANKWVTLYALLANKYREENARSER